MNAIIYPGDWVDWGSDCNEFHVPINSILEILITFALDSYMFASENHQFLACEVTCREWKREIIILYLFGRQWIFIDSVKASKKERIWLISEIKNQPRSNCA